MPLSSRWTIAGSLRVVADTDDLRVAGQQAVDERARAIAGAGVHHEPRRLVDHDQVVVLVDHGHHDRRIRLEARALLGRLERDLHRRPCGESVGP